MLHISSVLIQWNKSVSEQGSVTVEQFPLIVAPLFKLGLKRV